MIIYKGSHEGLPLHHLFFQIDGPAIDHEGAIPIGMDHPATLALRISPDLDSLQNEEVVLAYQVGVHHRHKVDNMDLASNTAYHRNDLRM